MGTTILMVGGGGREHALIRKLLESPRCGKIYCAPGNGGICRDAEMRCRPGDRYSGAMVAFAQEKKVDLAFVAPDDPLAAGMVDAFEQAGIRAWDRARTRLSSKAARSFPKTS